MTKLDPFLVGIPAAQMRMREPASPPPARRLVTLIDIAVALECSEHAIRQRARRSGWIYAEQVRRGRLTRVYPVAELPADIAEAFRPDPVPAPHGVRIPPRKRRGFMELGA